MIIYDTNLTTKASSK